MRRIHGVVRRLWFEPLEERRAMAGLVDAISIPAFDVDDKSDAVEVNTDSNSMICPDVDVKSDESEPTLLDIGCVRDEWNDGLFIGMEGTEENRNNDPSMEEQIHFDSVKHASSVIEDAADSAPRWDTERPASLSPIDAIAIAPDVSNATDEPVVLVLPSAIASRTESQRNPSQVGIPSDTASPVSVPNSFGLRSSSARVGALSWSSESPNTARKASFESQPISTGKPSWRLVSDATRVSLNGLELSDVARGDRSALSKVSHVPLESGLPARHPQIGKPPKPDVLAKDDVGDIDEVLVADQVKEERFAHFADDSHSKRPALQVTDDEASSGWSYYWILLPGAAHLIYSRRKRKT